MENILLIKYGEIFIRGKNKYVFEAQIIKAINKCLDEFSNYKVKKEQGRFLIERTLGEFEYDLIIPKIKNILGIVGICPGIKTSDQSIENLRELALFHMKEQFGTQEVTFKVESRRCNKKYPLDSREICRDVGGYIFTNLKNTKVDVHNPQVTLNIELRNDAYIFSKVIKCLGGLPYGSSGRGVLLLSGGLDSPVAGFMMAKRGVFLECVYFHSPPYTSERALEKVKDLAKRLSDFTGTIKLNIIDFTEIQLMLKDKVQNEKLTIFLKRTMLKICEKIAENIDAKVLIVGDSIGQVASQTIDSIYAIDNAVNMPILRPLSGMDKQEIINIAIEIETYNISIRPYEDCCTLFVAEHPTLKPKKETILKIESELDLEELVSTAISKITFEVY